MRDLKIGLSPFPRKQWKGWGWGFLRIFKHALDRRSHSRFGCHAVVGVPVALALRWTAAGDPDVLLHPVAHQQEKRLLLPVGFLAGQPEGQRTLLHRR